MRHQALFLFGLALLASISLAGGYPLPALLVLPAFLAYYWVRRKYFFCIAAAAFLLAAPMAAYAYVTGVMLFSVALAGIVTGRLMSAHKSLGISVAVLTLLVFGVAAGYSGVRWPAPHEEFHTALEMYGAGMKATDENADQVMALMTWMDDHWLYISFGMLFGVILLGVTTLQCILYRTLVAHGLISPPNFLFSRMRVPEHLVWVPIALAGLWFLDAWRPNDVVRFMAWNGAIAMACVYWLNGLSIGVHWVRVLQPRPIVVLLLVVAAIIFNFHQFFAVVGFFDTWVNFRLKINRIAQTRVSQEDKEQE